MKNVRLTLIIAAMVASTAAHAAEMKTPVQRAINHTVGQCYTLSNQNTQCFDQVGTPLPEGVTMKELRPVRRVTK